MKEISGYKLMIKMHLLDNQMCSDKVPGCQDCIMTRFYKNEIYCIYLDDENLTLSKIDVVKKVAAKLLTTEEFFDLFL